MLIRDWSSVVCSSDLLQHSFAGVIDGLMGLARKQDVTNQALGQGVMDETANELSLAGARRALQEAQRPNVQKIDKGIGLVRIEPVSFGDLGTIGGNRLSHRRGTRAGVEEIDQIRDD